MKTYPYGLPALALLSASLLAANAQPQLPGGGAPAGVTAALIPLFGETHAFTAKATVRILDADKQEVSSTPMDFALLDNKIRVSFDINQIRNRRLPAAVVSTLTRMDMARVTAIIRPDLSELFVLYPGQKVAVVMPLSDTDLGAAVKPPKIEKEAAGKETIDGRECAKKRVTIRPAQGAAVEAQTWEAPDLKDFPMQIATFDSDRSTWIRFTQVELKGLDSKQFEVPAGYVRYGNPREFMEAMQKKFEPQAKAK